MKLGSANLARAKHALETRAVPFAAQRRDHWCVAACCSVLQCVAVCYHSQTHTCNRSSASYNYDGKVCICP